MTPRRGAAQRWTRRGLALVPVLVFAMFVTDGSAAITLRLEGLVVLATTLIQPAIGLMLVAFLAPIGEVIGPLLGAPSPRYAETLVIAFLAGWLLVLAEEDEPYQKLPANLAHAMWIFGSVLIACVAATAWQLQRANPAELHNTLATLAGSYLLTTDLIGAHTAGQLLGGLGLIGAAALMARRDPRDGFRLVLALVASGIVASVASGFLAQRIAPIETLARQDANGIARYSAITGDVNATASLYLLLVGASVGVATAVRRARVAWLLATVILLAGLMLTRSAAGMIAGAVVLGVATIRWIVFASSRRMKRFGVLVLVPLVIGGITFARTARSANSLEFRGGFTQASLLLIEARPLFGVGSDRYYPLSKLVLSPKLSWIYGRENAHDYYLQLAAELGVVGVVAFAWVIAAALSAPIARVWKGRAETITAGCVGGVLAYMVTALAGHPFLVPQSAIPFWIVLGLLVAPQTGPAAIRSVWRGRAAIALGCALLLTVPLRGDIPQVRLPPDADGFGPWQADEAGRPFREAGSFASLFIEPAATAVEIPMRLRRDGRTGSATIAVSVLGSFGRELPVSSDWSTLIVPLPGAEPLVPHQRINLAVTLVQDGAPAPERLGVDIGEIRVVAAK